MTLLHRVTEAPMPAGVTYPPAVGPTSSIASKDYWSRRDTMQFSSQQPVIIAVPKRLRILAQLIGPVPIAGRALRPLLVPMPPLQLSDPNVTHCELQPHTLDFTDDLDHKCSTTSVGILLKSDRLFPNQTAYFEMKRLTTVEEAPKALFVVGQIPKICLMARLFRPQIIGGANGCRRTPVQPLP
jgi:hypothetical protein